MCEKNIAKELLDFTKKIASTNKDSPVNENEALELIECKAVTVMDAVCEANRVYMKAGMKLGASLIFQLLEK